MISIQPQAKESIVTQVRVELSSFSLNATEGMAVVTMFTDATRYVECQTVPIPPEIYSVWGTDDNFIVDYVLTELGLVRSVPESS